MVTTTTPSTNHFYPGMVCQGIEIFKDDQNVHLIINGQVKKFSEAPQKVVSLIEQQINKEPKTKYFLNKWHPNSSIKQIKTFAGCRFGGLDFQADILDDKLQDGEYHPCPNRDTCPAAGVLCKMPMYNGERLTVQTTQLIIYLTTTATNEVIAENLQVALGTLHLLKKRLYELLQVQTKQEVAIIARDLNLV
jgi:hypothetical protein